MKWDSRGDSMQCYDGPTVGTRVSSDAPSWSCKGSTKKTFRAVGEPEAIHVRVPNGRDVEKGVEKRNVSGDDSHFRHLRHVATKRGVNAPSCHLRRHDRRCVACRMTTLVGATMLLDTKAMNRLYNERRSQTSWWTVYMIRRTRCC